ncbi:hypothetical protein MRX96_006008 [Rhipicephalus microplus]
MLREAMTLQIQKEQSMTQMWKFRGEDKRGEGRQNRKSHHYVPQLDGEAADEYRNSMAKEKDSTATRPRKTLKGSWTALLTRKRWTMQRFQRTTKVALTKARRTRTGKSSLWWRRRSSRKRPRSPRKTKRGRREVEECLRCEEEVGKRDDEEAKKSQDLEGAVELELEENIGGEGGVEEETAKNWEAASDGKVEYYDKGDDMLQHAQSNEVVECVDTDDVNIVVDGNRAANAVDGKAIAEASDNIDEMFERAETREGAETLKNLLKLCKRPSPQKQFF